MLGFIGTKNFIKSFINTSKLVTIASFFIHANGNTQELQREFRSAEFLGKGDVGIATAKGMDAVFYNPAGIAQGKGILSEIVAVSPQLEGTQNLKQLYDSYNGGNKSALQVLAENQNSVFSAAAQNYSGVVFRKLAIGFLDRANANAYEGIDPNTGIPTANIYAANRSGVYLTLAHDFFSERFYFGMNGKFLQKKELNLSISALSAESQLSNGALSTVINNNLNQGSGVGADLGTMFILSKEHSTQLGIVCRNIGMEYRWVPEGNNPPTSEPTVLDVGFSTSFGTKKSKVTIATDLRDITNNQNAVIAKRIHMGLDYTLLEQFGISVGINQGYPTFGLFFNAKIIKVESGMYTEEIGSRAGEYPSQRIYGRIVLGWLL